MVEVKFIEKTLRIEFKAGDIRLPAGSTVWVHTNDNGNIVVFSYPIIHLSGLVVTILVNDLLINIPHYYLEP